MSVHVILDSDLLASNYAKMKQVPDVGPIIATNATAAIGDGKQFAAWIGITPRQHASGETSYMVSITKRGNRQLRTLFIHSARVLLLWYKKHADRFNRWTQSLM